MNDEQTPALRQAVENMANMRESYDNLSQAAEAYNTGKTELAANITAKGIPASATETLPELAEKVAQIAQETTIYDGADSYGKQIGAGGSLWDLYQVLANMKTRFMGTGDYAALIVCEYYKGYDSLQLQGADAYYTCDGDLYEYASPTHVWHDSENGKANRWVAFLYRDEGARLDITNTAISPRSMYIGGHIGTIEYFVNGRLTELVSGVEEADIVDMFYTPGFTNPWGKDCIINNVRNFLTVGEQDRRGLNASVTGVCVINGLSEIIQKSSNCSIISVAASYIVLKGCKVATGGSIEAYLLNVQRNAASPISIDIYDLEEFSGGVGIISLDYTGANKVQRIYIPKLKYLNITESLCRDRSQLAVNLIDIVVGELTTNLPCKTWNPTNVLADSTKRAQLIDNIKNHILARVSDATGSTQLVFTVSTNMYNNIASEQIEWQGETMSLADAFLTKNWLLSGA